MTTAMVCTVQAIQVAREFAGLASQDNDQQFTAMKLQKLLYYAQAWSLHTYGKPLFHEKIKAWENGPVVPQVYNVFKGMYSLNKNHSDLAGSSELSDDDRELIFCVWQMFKRYSGNELSDLTHQYAAFKRAREKCGRFNRSPEINRSDMVAEVDEYLRQQAELQRAFVQGLSTK